LFLFAPTDTVNRFSGNLRGPNWQPIESFSTEEYLGILRINLLAPLFLIRAAVPLLPPGGSIIATSSGVVANPVATSVLYGSSKAALTHTVRTLALQLMEYGIRVNGVAPGLTYSPFLTSGGFTTEMLELGGPTIPIARLAQPVEASSYYVYAADPTNTYLTGEVLAALGGDTGF
jgi:NAD(P)-dependent dehydrogenase (short-subunit alcohol dehydrogenase family)